MNCVGIDLAELTDWFREMFDLYVAIGVQPLDCGRSRKSRRQIEHGVHLDFGIDDRFAVGHGPRERVPTGGDVVTDGGEWLLPVLSGTWPRACQDQQQKNSR